MYRYILCFLLLISSGWASAALPCIEFDGESYCLVWAAADGSTISNEYLREGDTVEEWSRMITVKEYPEINKIKDFLPEYVKSVKPYFFTNQNIFEPEAKKHKEETYLVMTLLAPDKSYYEYVQHHVFSNEGGPVRSVIFSSRAPYGDGYFFEEIKENQWVWLDDLAGLTPKAYKKIP